MSTGFIAPTMRSAPSAGSGWMSSPSTQAVATATSALSFSRRRCLARSPNHLWCKTSTPSASKTRSALGLLPLEPRAPREDVLARYKVMQEFVRTSHQFGSMRQASEKLAARIAQENLARTAGYPDPIRLQWAMEGLATADLAAGPVSRQVEGCHGEPGD